MITKEGIEQALQVLDEASKFLLQEGAKREDLIKDNFRRDALALNRAAEVLETLPAYISSSQAKQSA